MPTICPKCGHERASSDSGPNHVCPKCGIIYAFADRSLMQPAPASLEPPLDVHVPLAKTTTSSPETTTRPETSALTNALEYSNECQGDLTAACVEALGHKGQFVAMMSAPVRFPAEITGITFAIGYRMGLPAPVTAGLTACMFPGLWRKECGKLALMMSSEKREWLEDYERIVARFESVFKALPQHVERSDEFFRECKRALNW